MAADDHSAAAGRPGDARRSGRGPLVALCVAAIACLAVAITAGIAAHAQLVRQPDAAQKSAAAAQAVAGRWRSWPAGRIFPATLSYDTQLLTTETANRVGISAASRCATALDANFAALAAGDRCMAGLRAAYLDQLQGVVYTVGVLAFPSARLAAAFWAGLHSTAGGAVPLRALALPGTATARFSASARQAATAMHDGPFVVLTVAGYADGQPAGAGQEPRLSVFAPAAQLASEVAGPLSRPVTVDCASPAWSC